ncbi:uncharacterized protein BCN122_III0737 [Burkholderia cenocepacia]|nr:uncharacterized protein BCN122_III0737 [Burkholderia cenocepacia]
MTGKVGLIRFHAAVRRLNGMRGDACAGCFAAPTFSGIARCRRAQAVDAHACRRGVGTRRSGNLRAPPAAVLYPG